MDKGSVQMEVSAQQNQARFYYQRAEHWCMATDAVIDLPEAVHVRTLSQQGTRIWTELCRKRAMDIIWCVYGLTSNLSTSMSTNSRLHEGVTTAADMEIQAKKCTWIQHDRSQHTHGCPNTGVSTRLLAHQNIWRSMNSSPMGV